MYYCLTDPECNAHAPYCHLWNDFRRSFMGRKIFVLILATNLSKKFLIVRRMVRDITINLRKSSCKVPVIFVRLYWNLHFLGIFSKNPRTSNFMKICPVGDEMFHADERTDRHDKTNSRFSKICESSLKGFQWNIKFMYPLSGWKQWQPSHINAT